MSISTVPLNTVRGESILQMFGVFEILPTKSSRNLMCSTSPALNLLLKETSNYLHCNCDALAIRSKVTRYGDGQTFFDDSAKS